MVFKRKIRSKNEIEGQGFFEVAFSWPSGIFVIVNPHCKQNLYKVLWIFYRPKYRYPYYDIHGKGKLLYGYGGNNSINLR